MCSMVLLCKPVVGLILAAKVMSLRPKPRASMTLHLRLSSVLSPRRPPTSEKPPAYGEKLQLPKKSKYNLVEGWKTVVVKPDVRVCVIGANGAVGSKIAMLLKLSYMVGWLNLYDINKGVENVAMDLVHVPTKTPVFGYAGVEKLQLALLGTHVVIICASKPRLANMTIGDMFDYNAEQMIQIVEAIINTCPRAFILVVTQPVESLVPLVAEVLKRKGLYDSKKLVGVTSSNVIRSTTILAKHAHCSPRDIIVPVMGGHSPETIVPVFSGCDVDPEAAIDPKKRASLKKKLFPYQQIEPSDLIQSDIEDMNAIVKIAEETIFKNKRFYEGSTITCSVSVVETAIKVIQGLLTNIPAFSHAYIETDKVPSISYCTLPVQFGPNGVLKQMVPSALSKFEMDALDQAIEHLEPSIRRGEEYVKGRRE